jgi:hypothetical protein
MSTMLSVPSDRGPLDKSFPLALVTITEELMMKGSSGAREFGARILTDVVDGKAISQPITFIVWNPNARNQEEFYPGSTLAVHDMYIDKVKNGEEWNDLCMITGRFRLPDGTRLPRTCKTDEALPIP